LVISRCAAIVPEFSYLSEIYRNTQCGTRRA